MVQDNSSDNTKTTPKQKRARHASAQASYMDRQRAQGKEWLATWVPKEGREMFKVLAKLSQRDDLPPEDALLQMADNQEIPCPAWARKNRVLLMGWILSIGGSLGKEPKDTIDEKAEHKPQVSEPDKKKKKKKKKKKAE